MKKTRILSIAACVAGFGCIIFSWQACKKSHTPPVFHGCGGPMVGSEPTTMMLVFTNVNNSTDADTAIWTNKTPNAGTQTIDNSRAHLTLSAGTSYHVQVYLLNINAPVSSSAYDVTPTVVKESSSYLVCFDMPAAYYGNTATGINWERKDWDNSPQPMPLGLADSFWTGSDSVCCLLQATLHHQYKVKSGDCSPGYIDIQAIDTVYISPSKGK